MPESRREALKIIGAIGATCAFPFDADSLYGQHLHTIAPAPPAASTAPAYFQKDAFALVSRLSDLIIPKTDTPGALEAGVPLYLDYVIGRDSDHQNVFTEGNAWLASESRRQFQKGFLELTEAEQTHILQPLSDQVDRGEVTSPETRFFALVKRLTADGYYTSRIGLVDELGYNGNTVLASFPGCVPEH